MLQNDINELQRMVNKINLNVIECSVLTMTYKPVKLLYNYMVDDEKFKRVTSKKDLGVTFDDKLSFNEHINA